MQNFLNRSATLSDWTILDIQPNKFLSNCRPIIGRRSVVSGAYGARDKINNFNRLIHNIKQAN